MMRQRVSPEEIPYVSRGGLKLASVASTLHLVFKDKVVLDVGSSTGGFTDYALQHGAKKVIAVEKGTNQMHPKLRNDPRVILLEQTDIRQLATARGRTRCKEVDMVLVDVSFVSLRDILPHIAKLVDKNAQIVAMVKPQFEADDKLKNRGLVKNETMRREVLKNFETWVQNLFVIRAKADSQVLGSKGNRERFYVLKTIK